MLKDPKFTCHLLFSFCNFSIVFLKPLQTSSPMIHRLYPIYLRLVHELLDKVIKESLLKKEGKSVPAKELKEIELQNEESQKVFQLTFKSFSLFHC